VHFGSFGLL
jgi:hypothetical protein